MKFKGSVQKREGTLTENDTSSSPQLFTQHQLDQALIVLSQRLGSRLITSHDGCAPYQTDDTGILGHASAVVLAESSRDLQVALEVCGEHQIPITTRAAGTGRTGGAVPALGGVVLATHKLDALVDVDRQEGLAVVQPGVILRDLWQAVEAEGWFYPPDPNSSDQ